MSNTASHDNHKKINSQVSFAFLYGFGAPLGGPSGHESSAIIETLKSHPIMPVFQTPPHTSEQLHGTHHTAVLRQHVLHREENAITRWHIESSPHWIRFGLIHPYHSKMTAIVALNSSFR